MFAVGDFVRWLDQDGIWRNGVIAYIAMPNTTLPHEYFKEGVKYKSRCATFGRYIVDCTMFGDFHVSKIGTEHVEYRAISFNNETAFKDELPWWYYA